MMDTSKWDRRSTQATALRSRALACPDWTEADRLMERARKLERDIKIHGDLIPPF